MTVTEVSRNRPDIIFGFRIIPCWVILKRCWRRESVWFSSKIILFFSSFRMILIKVDGLRRRFPPGVLTAPSATGNINVSLFIGADTSFALSLLAWTSDASLSSNSSNVCDQHVSFPDSSRRTIHNRGICLARLLDQIDVISTCPSQKQGDIRPLLQTVSLARWRAFRTAVHFSSSHQITDLWRFADSSNTPWNPPTIFHPDLIATILQLSRP